MRARIFKRYLGVLPMSVITNCRGLTILLAAVVMFGAGREALAQKKYDVGASDTEIKIGNIVPYSGPASAYGTVGKAMAAVFRKVNDEGGINGRKVNFISYAVFCLKKNNPNRSGPPCPPRLPARISAAPARTTQRPRARA